MYDIEDDMSIDKFDDMNLLLCCMELAELYSKLKTEYKHEFIVYLNGEFSSISIEDEYSELIKEILYFLENCKTGSELENCLTLLMDNYNPEMVFNVIKSMLEYLNETIEYIEYNF
jgi:hypothetical protein